MCEAVEKYVEMRTTALAQKNKKLNDSNKKLSQKNKVLLKEIDKTKLYTTIECCEFFGIEGDKIVDKLMNTYQLTRKQAYQAYHKYSKRLN